MIVLDVESWRMYLDASDDAAAERGEPLMTAHQRLMMAGKLEVALQKWVHGGVKNDSFDLRVEFSKITNADCISANKVKSPKVHYGICPDSGKYCVEECAAFHHHPAGLAYEPRCAKNKMDLTER
jgi:hypothetical protein